MINRRHFCGITAAMLMAGALPISARAKETIVNIDCHAHVFTRALKLADARRYAPDYDASIADYNAMLDRNGISHGVLIQPSFLGVDNSYLMEAVTGSSGRLRGVVVVEPSTPLVDLMALAEKGAVGVRWNLIGKPDPNYGDAAISEHLENLKQLGWQLEIQAESKRWPTLLPHLIEKGNTVVIDHFGLPDKETGVADPGFRFLLDAGASKQAWVKLSAPYRSGPHGEAIARAAYPLLKAAFGLDHLVWGSDWPHTQFEKVASPDKMRAFLADLVPDDAERTVIMRDAPARLFKFVV